MVIDPGNNINSASSSANKARQTTPSREAYAPGKAGSQSNSDNVSLSSTGQSLAKIEAELAKTSEVDESKVAQIKAAIASGRYHIDADSIAEKLLSDDSSFL